MPNFNTNIPALGVQHALTNTSQQVAKAMAELSSGLRVNSAADDAASSAIGQQMSARILSLNQAVRNANDGVSMVQTADGATQILVDMLGRMRSCRFRPPATPMEMRIDWLWIPSLAS